MLKLTEITQDNITTIPYDDLVVLHRGAHRTIKSCADPVKLKQAHDLIAVRLREMTGEDHGTPLDIPSLALSAKMYDNGMQMIQSGLYLKSPHGTLIYDGKKSVIAQSKPDDALIGQHIIISKENGVGLAFGTATIGQPYTVSRSKFNDYFDQHRVTIAECEKWWGGCDDIYLYPITSFAPYPSPRPVEIEPGVQMVVGEVKFIDQENQEEQSMPWKPSEAQSHTRAADTPEKQRQWAEVANSALEQCLEKGGDNDKCEASAIRQANSVVSKKKAEGDSDHPDEKTLEPGQDTCTCPNCGEVVEHERGTPCRAIKCPKCGAVMRGTTADEDVDDDKAQSDKDIPFSESADTVEAAGIEPTIPKDSLSILADMVANRLREDHFAFIRKPQAAVTPEPTLEPVVEAAPELAPDATIPSDATPSEPVVTESVPDNNKSLVARIKSALRDFFHPDAEPQLLPSFKVFHDKSSDKDWIILWTTNSYEDREKETFTISSIKDYVNRYADQPVKGEFWYAHTPGTKFGTILWQSDVADRFLVQMGTFDDTPIGDAFKEFFSKYPNSHPVIAPVGWGASHGFNYVAADRNDRTYDWFNTVESSVLPMHRAANIHNPSPIFTGGKDMQDKARAELQKISEDLGVNLLDLIESTAQQRKSELDEVVVHKEVNEEPVEEPSPDSQSQLEVAKSANAETASATDVPPVLTQEQSQPTPIDQEQFVKSLVEQVSTALIAKVSEEFGMESLSEAISTLTDRLQQTQATLDKQQSDVQMLTEQITELKRSDEDRLAEKEAHLPKFGAWSWQRMSQSETNVLSPNDPLTKATPVQAKVPDAIVRLAEQK